MMSNYHYLPRTKTNTGSQGNANENNRLYYNSIPVYEDRKTNKIAKNYNIINHREENASHMRRGSGPMNLNNSFNMGVGNKMQKGGKKEEVKPYNEKRGVSNLPPKDRTHTANARHELSKSSHAHELKTMLQLNYSPSVNKPKTGHKDVKDHLFMTYKNTPLNNPININYSSHDPRVDYSKTVNKNKTLLTKEYTMTKSPQNLKGIEKKGSSDSKKPLELSNPSAKSVKAYSYKEERNSQYREYMEDMPKIVDKFMNDNSRGLFCLYDGHGGFEPVKYTHNRFPEVFSRALFETSHNVEKSFKSAFHKIDEELKLLSNSQNVGTTACCLYFYRENDIICGSKRILTCANVGDTRAILITSNEVKRLSYDHKCTDESEVARIRKTGGVVFNGRMFGQLALSRALGDHAMKKYGLISTPFVNKHIITERDKFVVICSDGVWDVLSDGEVFEMAMQCSKADELAETIVKKACDNGSQDNISCIAIKLN